MLDRVGSFFLTTRIAALELYLALYSITWGSTLLLPIVTFNTDVYAVMARIADESQWAVAFMAVGSYQLLAVIANNWNHRRIAASAAAFFWIVVSVFFLASPRHFASVGAYLAMLTASGNLWCVWRWGFIRAVRR